MALTAMGDVMQIGKEFEPGESTFFERREPLTLADQFFESKQCVGSNKSDPNVNHF